MRSRSRSSHAGIDGESLQADVMRFMAIIGFCLVAIMALVRDVNPPVAQTFTQQETQHEKQSATPQATQQAPQPVLPEPPAKFVPLPQPAPEPIPEVVEEIQVARLEPVVVRRTVVADVPVVVEVPVIRDVPAVAPVVELPAALSDTPAEAPAQSEESLSLRFNSDRDFLRLITSGDVDLYLFQDQIAFRLAKNYAFQEAPAPRQLYELMPQTIPPAISAAAEAVVSNISQFKWGVVMPAHIERRIASLVAVETSGQLVIDRFGAVRHENNRLRDDLSASRAGGHG